MKKILIKSVSDEVKEEEVEDTVNMVLRSQRICSLSVIVVPAVIQCRGVQFYYANNPGI